MNDEYDEARFEVLLRERNERFPSITLPSEYAELFTVNTLQLLVKLARYKFAARLLKKTDDVLEVGSGGGLGALFLSQHVARVTGLEIRPEEHEAACALASRTNRLEFHLGSVFDYDAARRHDAVVSLDVIEHLREEDGRRFAARLARHCKADGVVIVGTPSVHSLPYQGAISRAAHIKCYAQHELVGLMDEHFGRTFPFSMNDEVVHTGHPGLAWYYFVLGMLPRTATP